MITNATARVPAHAPWGPMILAARKLRASFQGWLRRHRDSSELTALDDRMLRDMGLTRHDVMSGYCDLCSSASRRIRR